MSTYYAKLFNIAFSRIWQLFVEKQWHTRQGWKDLSPTMILLFTKAKILLLFLA